MSDPRKEYDVAKKKDDGMILQLKCLDENEQVMGRPVGCRLNVEVEKSVDGDGVTIKMGTPTFIHKCYKHDIDWVVEEARRAMAILSKAETQGEKLDRKQQKHTVEEWKKASDGVEPWWFMAHGITSDQMGDVWCALHEIVGDE